MGDWEATLIERAAAGDEAAFARILETHRDMVYTICHRTLGNAHDAEEAFQETFVSAFRGLGKFRGGSKLSTWLYRIALNRCRDFLSSRQERYARTTASLDAEEAAGHRQSLRAKESPATATVHEALAFLPEQYRTAVNLHCIMGYTYDEAGDIMGVPGGTVKTYVHRGKEALRDILKESE